MNPKRMPIAALAAALLGIGGLAMAQGAPPPEALDRPQTGTPVPPGTSGTGGSARGSGTLESEGTTGLTGDAPARRTLRDSGAGGSAPQVARMAEEEVREKLRAQGWSDIGELTLTDDVYVGTASRDGRQVELRIEPHSGRIVGQQPRGG